ncbi:hypothetical protein ACIG0C_36830, partial [Kitasatospora aureofaciens]
RVLHRCGHGRGSLLMANQAISGNLPHVGGTSVQGSARGMGPDAAPNIERVLMGTLIGAYLSTGDIPNHDGPTLASLGAIAGAAAMAVGAFTMDTISRIPPSEYLTTSD